MKKKLIRKLRLAYSKALMRISFLPMPANWRFELIMKASSILFTLFEEKKADYMICEYGHTEYNPLCGSCEANEERIVKLIEQMGVNPKQRTIISTGGDMGLIKAVSEDGKEVLVYVDAFKTHFVIERDKLLTEKQAEEMGLFEEEK